MIGNMRWQKETLRWWFDKDNDADAVQAYIDYLVESIKNNLETIQNLRKRYVLAKDEQKQTIIEIAESYKQENKELEQELKSI